MLFNSLEFFIFFPVVTILYFIIPHRYRWFLLLVASCYFYMAFIPIYILVLFFTILVDYIGGILIEKSLGWRPRFFLIMSIIANVGVLVIFKYFNFFNSNLHSLYEMIGLNYPIHNLSFILPVGLSFHTFQSLSYTIEVYLGHQKAERHLGIFALYVMFYPQLVAGPIERPQHILHQLHTEQTFDYSRVTNGLKLMTWGLFKKVVIADGLAIIVNQVYNQPQDYQGFPLIIATIFFAYQIYCDFSGYSDIARGSAQVMGIRLMKNFDSPYLSSSISEFWKRWHISLSTWFRDYLYIPLGGNRVPKWRWYLNLLTTFLVSGLWHGASWTFIIWGGVHGLYLIIALWIEAFWSSIKSLFHTEIKLMIPVPIRIFSTFLLVCFAWIFFRANNLSDATYIISHLFSGMAKTFTSPLNILQGLDIYKAMPAIIALIIMEGVQIMQKRINIPQVFSRQPTLIRWVFYYVFIFYILFFGVYGESQFIYFQF